MLPLTSRFSAIPGPQGLYHPGSEVDSCGVAMIATLRGEPSHQIVEHALTALRNLDHRGAVGAEENTGDGTGIMVQLPDAFLREVSGLDLPPRGAYAAGTAFVPRDRSGRDEVLTVLADIAAEEGMTLLGTRDLPVAEGLVGPSAEAVRPDMVQVFLADAAGERTGLALERAAFAVRRRVEHSTEGYFPSLSTRVMVYKGMLTPFQLDEFYPDLRDPRFASELAIVHSRFSTNTFPAWPLAHPFRTLAHNGEINTVIGNRNRLRAAEGAMSTDVFGEDFSRLLPVNTPGASDSAGLDEALELLHLSGRSLAHSLMMLIPEPWENDSSMDPVLRDFYEYHAALQEPWDGPAAVVFTDGTQVGARLDRNGLRPLRYWVTDEDLVVLGSETGLIDVPRSSLVRTGRVAPGEIFLLDLAEGEIVPSDELKQAIATERPYGTWLREQKVELADLPAREHITHSRSSVVRRQQTFGYTEEELRVLLAPMAAKGAEPLGAMGTDTPIAVLSDRPRLLFDYFTQMFAQVTNPPLDSLREEIVTSLGVAIGRSRNLLDATPLHARQLSLGFPILDNDQLAKIVAVDANPDTADLHTTRLRGLYPVAGGTAALEQRLQQICEEAVAAIDEGATFLVLSDRHANHALAPIPSLLLTSAVQHHLVRTGRRTSAALLVEAGDVREVHHAALLIGYGASAVNPYLAMESVEELVHRGVVADLTPEQAVANLNKALGKGVLKIMSKMGIATVASYRGAQIFEAVGLSQELVDTFFPGTISRIGGITLEVIAAETAARHSLAYPVEGDRPAHRSLPVGGEYQWRREGEPHLFTPEAVFRLQHSTRTRQYEEFRKYTDAVDDQHEQLMTLRGLLRLRTGALPPVPLDEVEPVESITRRFMTGAMSYGSISQEAHETLAIAMNRLGGMSNSGEGGEDPERLRDPERRSAIKQIASGRFGVTSEYLTFAKDIQIKIAQGAKPGEGGQLPPEKVYPWIARTRHSTPGIGLISPPPHHDIYSIEDLAQLIHDAKSANPAARVHVKLVSRFGVGTVASGVSKAHADVVLISGHDGGTGASPLNSLKHAGTPWELGLAETQQTLLLNGLRDRITVQVDGQMKTGRDVVIAALLGAEEYGFASAPLVVAGCVMMRVCHLDTCPVGVATQNPELRERFTGKAEHVVAFFQFVAEQVREHLASLGLRSLDEAIGRGDLLELAEGERAESVLGAAKREGLDLGAILAAPTIHEGDHPRRRRGQDHQLDRAPDHPWIEGAAAVIDGDAPSVRLQDTVRNVQRSAGTLLGHEVTRRTGGEGLAEDAIVLDLEGTGGQSFGAFLPRGVSMHLTGDANDYVGKGLSGGIIAVGHGGGTEPSLTSAPIAGNTCAYGATSGRLLLAGSVGERFGVRNSGATLVVEGIGDHGAEYMTGGAVVVLGPTGRNLGAGMSGGTLFVLDLDPDSLNPADAAGFSVTPVREEHRAFVLESVRDHAARTGSDRAAALLADEDELLGRLTEISPRAFLTITALREDAVARGNDPDANDVWNEILEATHG
ncbi:glutamate synthase large subunit [Brachybacterium saurashtrense]|uniref:Glutamate synthase large subunit n=1 Tax=Brachybacterium saurashtrense TaxID=556288 RepID=A0A345YM72_9MICO|nr:glutamate synthase large subunit [Brachybacterium saurashtrense]AXK45024.1 glutamate synthase large subunit [Brachybacterium saurashtrense]RRR21708.1 glutamate synthase large subunit [Brachybacterium saurashtrense]